jgi:hypothetical protein
VYPSQTGYVSPTSVGSSHLTMVCATFPSDDGMFNGFSLSKSITKIWRGPKTDSGVGGEGRLVFLDANPSSSIGWSSTYEDFLLRGNRILVP